MANRTVVVTGGFGVLGRAAAEAALAEGLSVAAIDRAAAPDPPLSPDIMAVGGVDLSDGDQAAAAIEAVTKRYGRIDALLNIAGGFVWQTTRDGDPAQWERLYRLNVLTALHASRAALPHLLAAGGRIVNVGANGALKAAAGMGPYAASKAGVHRLTEALAEETKGRGVTVNAVLPSIIDTPANRAEMPDADFDQWVSPAGLAAVMLFLASPAAGPVTGALLPVTGGV